MQLRVIDNALYALIKPLIVMVFFLQVVYLHFLVYGIQDEHLETDALFYAGFVLLENLIGFFVGFFGSVLCLYLGEYLFGSLACALLG